MADTNLEDVLEQLQFNYGGVLQKLAELHDEVVDQMEMLKTAGTKIRRRNTSYAKDTVLVCVGRNNGNKFLKCKTAGTTSDVQWTEATYTGFTIGSTVNDGTVVWEVMETAFTSGSIVWSAMNASHAEIADYASSADSATSAGYALSAGYIGPFQVVNLGAVESSGYESSGGPIVTSTGINYSVVDNTARNWGSSSVAGVIINGKTTIPVPGFTGFLADGQTLYLWGSSGADGTDFKYGYRINSQAQDNEFITALAHNEGGKVTQIQFGDIVTPWPGDEGGEIYNGPFKVEANSSVDSSGTVHVRIYDPTAPINASTSKPEWAGKIFAGGTQHTVQYAGGNLSAGDYLYLVGDSKNGSVSFDYTAYVPEVTSDGAPDSSANKMTITSAGFYVRLAKNEGGKIVQLQHGDITVPPWKVTSANHATSADSATHATYADNVDYKGPFRVATSGTGIQVYDDSWPNTFGGAVIIGSNGYRIGSATGLASQAGFKIYLEGTSNYDGAVSLRYRAIQDGATISALKENQFLTPLAAITSGGIMQIQYGNITQPFHTEEYQGPFKVAIAGTSTVVNNSGTESATSSTAYTVTITDTISAAEISSDQKAGKVFDGAVEHEVASSSIQLADGQYVYLQGSSAADGTVAFEFVTTPDDEASTSLFFTRLAKNQGGRIIQIHEGDIVTPWHAGQADFASMAMNASSAVRAAVADYVEYKGPFHVSALTDSTAKMYDDSRASNYGGAVVIGENVTYVGSENLNMAPGDTAYLVGTSAPGGTLQCVCSIGSHGQEVIAGQNQFCAQLAKRTVDGIFQIQFGDIVQPFHSPEYEGPFKVVVNGSSSVITNSGMSDESSSTTYDVSILDTISAAEVSSDQKAGKVFDGKSAFEIPSSAITVNDGDYIYLRTSYSITSGTLFEFTTSSGTDNRTRCFTRLAKNQGGRIAQIQHGDITIPQFVYSALSATNASSAIHATEADRFAYKGPFNILCSATGQHLALVQVVDDIRNKSGDSSWAGAVIVGDSTYKVVSSSLGLILNGYRLYLKGTFVDGSDPTFAFGSIGAGSGNPSVNANEFYTYLGFVSNGAFVRTQYGDIVQPVLGQGQSYNGPFKVQITSSSTSTTSSGGSTTSNTTYDVRVYDPTDPSSNPYHAGRVFDGASETILNFADIIGLEDGAFVYLNGISGSGMGITDSSGVNNASSFSIRLAQVSAGGIVQMQYGDVYSIPWNVTYANQAGFAASANTALEANYASSAGYIGPFHVSATSVNTVTNAATVTIYDDTRVSSIGGYVVVGSNTYPAGTSGGMTLSNGYKMFLIGSSTSSGGIDFLYSAANSDPSPGAGETWMFYAQLAYNNGGKVVQTHYGDIVQPQEGVKKIIAGSNVTVSPAEGVGEVTINATGGGGSGGVPFPNYAALNAYGAGDVYKQSLEAGKSYQAAGDGWLRVSLGNNEGCNALIVNGNRIGIYGHANSFGITFLFPLQSGDIFSLDASSILCMFFDAGTTDMNEAYIVTNSIIFYRDTIDEDYTSWTSTTPMQVIIGGVATDVYTVYTASEAPSRYANVYLESTLETYIGDVRWRNIPS